MASEAPSADSSGALGSEQQPETEVPAPPDEPNSSGYLDQPASDQFDREAMGEAPAAAAMPLEAAFGNEAEVVQVHAQDANTTETDAEVSAVGGTDALITNRDVALEQEASDHAASLAEAHLIESAAQDAAAAEQAAAPVISQAVDIEPEPAMASQAPQATPRNVDEGAAVPLADSLGAALADSDAATNVAPVPGTDTTAAAAGDAVSAVSDGQVEPPAGSEPAQAESAADIDNPVQPPVDLSELSLESAEAAAEAGGSPPPSAEAEATVEQGLEAAKLTDALPALSTVASEARLHSNTEPSAAAEGSEDLFDPTADSESVDASVVAVGSTAEGAAEAAESGIVLLTGDVAPDEVDGAAVSGELAPHEELTAELNRVNPVADGTGAVCSAAEVSLAADGEHGAAEGSTVMTLAQESGQQGDAAVVLPDPERSSAGVSLPVGPSANGVPAETGPCSLSPAEELLTAEENSSGDLTSGGPSPEQRAVVDTVSTSAPAEPPTAASTAEHIDNVAAVAGPESGLADGMASQDPESVAMAAEPELRTAGEPDHDAASKPAKAPASTDAADHLRT